MSWSNRTEEFILAEYAAHGLRPHRASNGTLVSLSLARKLGVKLARIPTPEQESDAA